MDRLKAIQLFHDRLFESATDTAVMAGWGSRESQRSRFSAMIRSAHYSGGSVLDFGCGPGDLYGFLSSTGYSFDYLGVDQDARMIALAIRQYGQHFEKIRFDEMVPQQRDYVFASGVFQFRGSDNGLYVRPMLRKLFSCCRKALAVTLLSSRREESTKVPEELYFQSEEAIDIARSLSEFWCVDHSYHAGRGDMTIAMHKIATSNHWKRPGDADFRLSSIE